MATTFSRIPRMRRGEIHIEATDARQGRWGRHMFWVLVASTTLAAIALFGSWVLNAGDLADADMKSRPPAVAEPPG